MFSKAIPGGTVWLSGALRMKEFRKLANSESASDFEAIYPLLSRLVDHWDLVGEDGQPLDPKDPASFDELEVAQYKAITAAMGEYLAESLEKN